MAKVLIDVDDVTVTRPDRDLFRDVSLTISEGDRIGIVGINGTGKSTLLRVIAGSTDAESGTVRAGKETTVAMLDQEAALPDMTVREAVFLGSDQPEWEAEAVLDRLAMTPFLNSPTSQLSGGEAKRVALARALLAPSDLLILDEPTNHLDIVAIEWLEARLASYRGALLLVTHDRHVLDRVTNRILELDRGASYVHAGGYQGYLDGRAEREEHVAAANATIRNLARKELAWLKRGAPARTSKAKARIRSAEALVSHRPEAAAREGKIDLHLGTPRLGDRVVELHDVGFGYGSTPLFEGVDLMLDRRERLGIVGLNGSGKSTLLSIIAGRREPATGRRDVGETVQVVEFLQHGPDLDGDTTVIETVANGGKPNWQDKAFLEKFWFDSDVQRSPVRLLSGGEKRRLQLVLALRAQPNVLLLDEPTNDLDLDTLRSLEDFLDEWPGCLVVVSHDRAFLERTVDDVLVVEGGRAQRIPGGYAAWEEAALATRAAPKPGKGKAKKINGQSGGRSASTIRHELMAADKALAKVTKILGAARVALESRVEAGDVSHVELTELGRGISEAEQDVETAELAWLELSQELEDRLAR